MTTIIDLEPAARRIADLVRAVPDDLLAGPTPCPDYSVGDLLEHVGGLAIAFRAAATKRALPGGSRPPSGDAARLGEDWRSRIPGDLLAMAGAWREPDAWTGLTKAGGIDLPGAVAGVVALDEIVIHGWDLAMATGQPYRCDQPTLEAVRGFLERSARPDQQQARSAIFGPVIGVPDGAPLLDLVVGLAGREPSWAPARAAAPGARR